MAELSGEVRAAMAEYGLYPKGEIIWDGQYHRMPGADKGPKNKAGWYVAAIDRSHVNFGDWSTGLKSFWRDAKPSRYDAEVMERWKREADEAKQAASEKAEYALAQMKDTWERAKSASARHPYLVAKDMKSQSVLRIVRQADLRGEPVLLVPMRIGRKLLNVQRVYGNGAKRFWPGQSWEGCTFTFGGGRAATSTVYLCEGWATAGAIHRATGCTTVAAFVAANLKTVAERLVKKLDSEIIIAADNDRWTEGVLAGGRRVPNPGVWYARDAATVSPRIRVAIPDFQQLASKPTDFDDLLRQEDQTAVLHWLDPANATSAITEPVLEEETAVDPDEGEYAEMWQTAPFACLGLIVPPGKSPQYAVMDHDSGETFVLQSNQMRGETTYIQLAPYAWWETYFGNSSNGRVRWTEAAAVVMDMCKRRGRMKRGHHREIGAWKAPKGVVVHCGRKLLDHKGEEQVPWKYDGASRHVYAPANEDLGVPAKPLSLDRCRRLFGIVERFSWRSEGDPYLVAGWTLLAPVCGLLRWRPHVWVNGPAGSGKSTLLAEVIRPLTYPSGIKIEAGTTEASLRRVLGRSARPVLLDELERKQGNRDISVRALLDFVRSSSSADAPILKSQGDGVVEYGAHSMFMLASVAGGVENAADATRISAVHLTKKHDQPGWDEQLRDIGNITHPVSRALWGRTIELARSGTLQKTVSIARRAVTEQARSARQGDQMGTLAAGAWLMLNDEPPEDVKDIAEWYESIEWGDPSNTAQTSEGQLILDRILQAREPSPDGKRMVHKTIGEMIVNVRDNPLASEDGPSLERCGMKINDGCLFIAIKSEFVRKTLADTPYGFAWQSLLKAMGGVTQGKQLRFSGVRSYTVCVPLKLFLD